jgi:Uncharacterized protein conserved in bacteria
MTDTKPFNSAAAILPDKIKARLQKADEKIKANATEIFISSSLVVFASDKHVTLTRLSSADIAECFRAICGYSVHSHADDIKEGFITLPGGHRAGIYGTAVLDDGKSIKSVRDIAGISIRIARELIGCSDGISFNPSRNLLVCGAPSCGKTTIIRDIARKLTSSGCKVAIIDSRGEIGAAAGGAAQNTFGATVCVLTGYPKVLGINIALRTLSPDVIVCDEIGSTEDMAAIQGCGRCGVSVIATAHCGGFDDLKERENIAPLAGGVFKDIVVIEKYGRIKERRCL